MRRHEKKRNPLADVQELEAFEAADRARLAQTPVFGQALHQAASALKSYRRARGFVLSGGGLVITDVARHLTTEVIPAVQANRPSTRS